MKILDSSVVDRVLNKLEKRPLVIPAVLGVVFMLCVVKNHILVAVILLLLMLLLLGLVDMRLRLILIASIAFISYLFIGLYQSGILTQNEDNVSLSNEVFKVVSVEDRLDGSSRVVLYNSQYGRVMFNTFESERPYKWSNVVLNGKLLIPDTPSNPGEFDYASFLRNQGISYLYRGSASVFSNKTNFVELYDVFLKKIYRLKLGLIRNFSNYELAGAMFLGDTSLIDDDTKTQFKEGNLSHLLAVSGTHFSGFMALVPFLFSKIKNKRIKGTSFFLFVGIIVVMTGATASVVRAAFMSCCSFISRDKISGIGLATIILGLLSPFTLVSIGFLMSFVLCISIIGLSGFLDARLNKHLRSLSESISVVIAAQIGMIPFWTTIAPKLGLIRVLLQFIASFLAQICCTLFVPGVILAHVARGFILPCDLLIGLINKLAKITSQAPFVINTTRISVLLSFVVLGGSVVLVLPGSVIRRVLTKVVALLTVTALVYGGYSYISCPAVKVIFIDVGQGDSILVLSKDSSLLIDGGAYDKGETVAGVLDYYGITVPDFTVVTHWDEDHCGGIRYLAEQGRCGTILASYYDADISNINLIKSGDSITVGNATLKCINPLFEHEESNDRSVVLELNYNDCSILFTGDIPMEIESELVHNHKLNDIDILKVAHHGSRYSTSSVFLDVINPEYAVISVGKYNDYGHPSDEVLQRLEGVQIYETDKSGAILVGIYNDRYEISSYRSQAMITKDSSVC